MASFWLEFEQGGRTERVTFQGESISIGRDRSSDFVLDHPTVSRQHALIVHQGNGRFQLVVLSRNGLTAVNGRQVQTTEVDLHDQTSLTFGQYTVRFRSQQAPQAAGQRPASMGSYGGGGGSPSPHPFGDSPGYDGGMEADGVMSSVDPSEQLEQPPGQSGQEEPKADAAGIKSWDEIAASSQQEDEESEAEVQETDFQRIQRAKDEESNPVIIIGALGLAALFLLFALFSGGGESETVQGDHVPFDEWEVVEISVSCHDPATCRREAERHYELATDFIDRSGVEEENLFIGYKNLLEARAYLEEAGIEDFPGEMSDWQRYHDQARSSLDETFSTYRRRFHQASQRDRRREMANILDEIQVHFPDRTSRENRWARERERMMRAEGIYPRR